MKFEMLLNRLVPTLYEDDYLLAVAKPAGIDAGGLERQSAPGLAEILARVRNRGESFEPANRLSRYESGILLLGKNPAMVQHIRTGLKSNRIQQEYVVVVIGRMNKPKLTIGAGFGSSRGHTEGRGRNKPKDGSNRPSTLSTSLTGIKVGAKRSIIRCQTSVSTTHALRAQLRAARLRALGDKLYDRSRRPASREMTCFHLSQISFFHPVIKKKMIIHSDAPDSFVLTIDGKFDVIRPLQAALVRRLECFNSSDTDSFRLITGDLEDMKGLVAEKFGKVIVLQKTGMTQSLTDSMKDIAHWYKRIIDARTVYIWDQSKQQATRTVGGMKSRLVGSLRGDTQNPIILGNTTESKIQIQEYGLKFIIHPDDGPAVGLFLDHRENRQRIRSMSAGKDVLNLFAYTCGFSVAAAAGGASSTVSVDLSGKILDWGKNNFRCNHLPLDVHRFYASDAFDFLKRAKRQGMCFDLMILDPPSFAHGRKRKQDFSIARDLGELVAASVQLLNSDGVMMVSTNYRRMSIKGLRERIGYGARIAGRRYRVIDIPQLPTDSAIDPDHAGTIFTRFE